MGWASGSRLFDDIIDICMNEISNYKQRVIVYEGLISSFENHDCDTLGECLGKDKAFDQAYRELYPEDEE